MVALAATTAIQIYVSLAATATAVLAPEIAQAFDVAPKWIGVFVGLVYVGAMLASTLLTTYAELDRKMAGEFRRYGANLVIAPISGADSLSDNALIANGTFDDFLSRIQAATPEQGHCHGNPVGSQRHIG